MAAYSGAAVGDVQVVAERNSECRLRPEEELGKMYRDLLYLKRKGAEGFILKVFNSTDRAWV